MTGREAVEKLCGGRFLCEALGFITLAFIILLFVCFGLAMPIQFILEFDLVVCRCKYNNPSVSVGVLVWVCNRNNQSIMHLGIVTMSQEEFGTV